MFAVNCMMSREALYTEFIVFGTVLRPARTIIAPMQLAEAFLVDEDMKEVEREQARRRSAFGLKHECLKKAWSRLNAYGSSQLGKLFLYTVPSVGLGRSI